MVSLSEETTGYKRHPREETRGTHHTNGDTSAGNGTAHAHEFQSLFFVRHDVYGAETRTGGGTTHKTPVTSSLIASHLAGQRRIGAHTTNSNNLSQWGCIDDDYTGHDKKPLTEHERQWLHALGPKLMRKARDYGITLHLEVSRRGGWHLWLFCAEPIPAALMRRILRFLLALCGVTIGTKAGGPCNAVEIFPCQDEITVSAEASEEEAGYGNFVYLPFFANGANGRSVIVRLDDDGTTGPLSCAEFLATVQPVPSARLQELVTLHGGATEQQKPPKQKTQRTAQQHSALWRDLTEALPFIPAVDHDIWLRTGMGIHSVDSSEAGAGFDLWVEWSKRCPEKFKLADCKKRWESFTATGGVTERTIFALAIKYGWRSTSAADGEEPQPHTAQPERNEAPRPLRRQLPPPAPFPVEALGTLAPVVQKLREVIKAPDAICAQSILGSVALAVQPYADIIIDGRVSPVLEYFLTVGESGERKTAVDREALFAHRAYEKELVEQYKKDTQGFENDFAAFTKTRDEELKKTKGREARKQALDALGDAPAPPLQPIILCTEPTYEGLIKLLQHGQPSVGLFADEGGRFVGGYGMSDTQQLKTATGLSELWDGKSVSRVRSEDGATILYGRRFSLHLMMQPEVAQQLLGNKQLLDQGLLSRCLVSWPTSTAGTRKYKAVNLRKDRDVQQYNERITAILKTPLPLAKDKDGKEQRNELAPRLLPLSEKAKALWIRFHDAVESQLAEHQPFAPIRGFANKAAEHAARLAGDLTLYDDLRAKEVAPDRMGQGITLAQHYLDEALRLFHASQSDPDLVLAEKLLAWSQEGGSHVALVDIYQRGPNAIRDIATARRIIAILQGHGWFVPVPDGKEIDGHFRREVWEVKKDERS